MKRVYRIVPIGLVVIGVVAMNWLLLIYPWDGFGGAVGMWKQAWALAQGCLIALWAVASLARWFVRFPVLLIGTAWTWYLVMGPWLGSLQDAGFAVTFAAQALCILLINNLILSPDSPCGVRIDDTIWPAGISGILVLNPLPTSWTFDKVCSELFLIVTIGAPKNGTMIRHPTNMQRTVMVTVFTKLFIGVAKSCITL